jgi:hypothetical protein
MRKSVPTVLLLLLGFALVLVVSAQRGQDATPTPTPTPINQHFKVVPNVAPADLQKEFERLNEEGFNISIPNNLLIIGDRVTIVVDDSDRPAAETEESEEEESR